MVKARGRMVKAALVLCFLIAAVHSMPARSLDKTGEAEGVGSESVRQNNRVALPMIDAYPYPDWGAYPKSINFGKVVMRPNGRPFGPKSARQNDRFARSCAQLQSRGFKIACPPKRKLEELPGFRAHC